MPRETFRQVHVDRPLTNFSVAYFQDTNDFVSHRFFPSIGVNHASDKYTFYPGGYFNRIEDSKRAEEGVANTIGYKTVEHNYSCGDDALRTFISDRKRANVDVQRQLDHEATILVTASLMLGKEQEFVDNFMTAGKWTTERTGVVATPTGGQFLVWSDASSDPVKDVSAARVEMIRVGKRRPNRGIMTLDVYETLRNHPDILERIKYTGTSTAPAMAGVKALAELFELEEILIMQTVVNLALEGVEDPDTGMPPTNDQFMASGTFLMAHVVRSAGLMTPVAGLTFLHNRYIQQGIQGGPAVRRYRESPAKKGEYIEAEYSMDQKLVAPDLGCLMLNCI